MDEWIGDRQNKCMSTYKKMLIIGNDYIQVHWTNKSIFSIFKY